MSLLDEGPFVRGADGPERILCSVIVADASPVVRAGLVACISAAGGGWHVAQMIGGAAQLETAAIGADCIVLAGDRIIQGMPASWPGWGRTLAVLAHEDPLREAELLRLGLAGVLTLGADEIELAATLERVRRGELVVSLRAARLLSAGDGRLLSPRQRAILTLLSESASPAEIAHQLGISQSTVKTHIARLQQRFGIRGVRALGLAAEALLREPL